MVLNLRHLHNLVHRHLPVLDVIVILDALDVLDLWDLYEALLDLLPGHMHDTLLYVDLRHLHYLFFVLHRRRTHDLFFYDLGLGHLDDPLYKLGLDHLPLVLPDNDLRHLDDLLEGVDRPHAADDLLAMVDDGLVDHPPVVLEVHVHGALIDAAWTMGISTSDTSLRIASLLELGATSALLELRPLLECLPLLLTDLAVVIFVDRLERKLRVGLRGGLLLVETDRELSWVIPVRILRRRASTAPHATTGLDVRPGCVRPVCATSSGVSTRS
mmetsp:Transcript_141898/g.395495  ORF Transcript_141898/g.395495 Transcript_141898/m.395495 type:complete len:271 (-) Transcript_141898:264-1076(-)